MSEAKRKEIVNEMFELGLINPVRAEFEPTYLDEMIDMYMEAKNLADSTIK